MSRLTLASEGRDMLALSQSLTFPEASDHSCVSCCLVALFPDP
jgi:hypothetical protein